MATSKANTGSRSMSTRNPRGAGRKPSLTKEVQELILTNRRLGISWERSARLAGVSNTSVKNWRAQGEAALEKVTSKRTAFDNKCIEFFAATERADDEWIRRCETVLAFSMEPGSGKGKWDAASDSDKDRAERIARFKLTHQASDEYSTRARTELAGKDGGPVDIALNGEDVFKILLEAKAYEDAQDADN